METGCQNIQLCVAILKVTFAPDVIGPMFLFPLIYITFQCMEALLLTLCFRCYRAFKPPAEGKGHSCLLCFSRVALESFTTARSASLTRGFFCTEAVGVRSEELMQA